MNQNEIALSQKVDDLIQLFADTPVVDPQEVEERSIRFWRVVRAKMRDGTLSYGAASGTMEFLNKDEDTLRAFMKQADQDLAWQCSTVADAFRGYLENGEIPAPHYPMRIAILLRKIKDLDRERKFLAVWCKHFPTGNGATYAALVERAKKVGAIPT